MITMASSARFEALDAAVARQGGEPRRRSRRGSQRRRRRARAAAARRTIFPSCSHRAFFFPTPKTNPDDQQSGTPSLRRGQRQAHRAGQRARTQDARQGAQSSSPPVASVSASGPPVTTLGHRSQVRNSGEAGTHTQDEHKAHPPESIKGHPKSKISGQDPSIRPRGRRTKTHQIKGQHPQAPTPRPGAAWI